MFKEIENFLISERLEYKAGAEYFAISCPFAKKTHEKKEDANPSFVIYPTRDFAKCFSCGVYFNLEQFLGDYSDFYNRNLNLEWLSTIITIPKNKKEIYNIELPDNIMEGFEEDSPEILQYLKDRGIYRKNIPFKLFYDRQNNNICQTINNPNGKIVGATSRNLSGYGNKSHHYFGIFCGKSLLGLEKQDGDSLMIVEGPTDMWNAYCCAAQLGWNVNVYATLTARLSDWQANTILDQCKPIIMAYDVDQAGLKGRKEAKQKMANGIYQEVLWENPKIDIGNMSVEYFESIFKDCFN